MPVTFLPPRQCSYCYAPNATNGPSIESSSQSLAVSGPKFQYAMHEKSSRHRGNTNDFCNRQVCASPRLVAYLIGTLLIGHSHSIMTEFVNHAPYPIKFALMDQIAIHLGCGCLWSAVTVTRMQLANMILWCECTLFPSPVYNFKRTHPHRLHM